MCLAALLVPHVRSPMPRRQNVSHSKMHLPSQTHLGDMPLLLDDQCHTVCQATRRTGHATTRPLFGN